MNIEKDRKKLLELIGMYCLFAS